MTQAQAETTLCADECCAPPALVLPPKASGEREALIREAFKLEWLTIGWMSVEAVVAIWSGLMAGSLVLTAFGLDSLIELASAGVLIRRLTVELRHGQAFSENAERLASRIAGGLLFALAAYITRLYAGLGGYFCRGCIGNPPLRESAAERPREGPLSGVQTSPPTPRRGAAFTSVS